VQTAPRLLQEGQKVQKKLTCGLNAHIIFFYSCSNLFGQKSEFIILFIERSFFYSDNYKNDEIEYLRAKNGTFMKSKKVNAVDNDALVMDSIFLFIYQNMNSEMFLINREFTL